MDKQIGFALVVAAFVLGLIAGPVSHLWTGQIRYRKYKADEWYGYKRRRDDPVKFYAHVVLETLVMLLLLCLAYWMMFHLKPRA